MRILRVRRGYTTNSSGANEWVPPANLGKGSTTLPEHTDRGVEASPAEVKQVTIIAAQPRPQQDEPSAAGASRAVGNIGIVGVLVGVVFFLFAATRFLRRMWAKRR
ncbi:MAG: hypothetical protein A2289_20405 [Deltaproteobacteria bacterium RIFOXYA12_FULL_58_15]|nr:MAG: hypothetical protein A2289_20405 [Deltaproteobacteria bacterium RIFOXYA12_FULL_58_15]OGR14368.1 MAG: hypothetical protein A2341_25575 [Deltaproteobacteria bacterium RIFOXYB12_FULL_58_9]